MAFVVRRPSDRFEIRESELTPRGPRARTLVTFREVSDEVLDLAAARARGRLDRARLQARAIELGARAAPPEADTAARRLLVSLGRGDHPPAAVTSLLAEVLQRHRSPEPNDHLLAMLPWLAASDTERATALVDLLGVADALPRPPRRRALRFPRLVPR